MIKKNDPIPAFHEKSSKHDNTKKICVLLSDEDTCLI